METSLYGVLNITNFKLMISYIDPGTGSFVIQVIIGVLFGVLYALKLFWGNILRFFKKLVAKNDSDTSNDVQ